MVDSKQLSNNIKSTPNLSVQNRQASSQETPTTSGPNSDQEDIVITIKKIIKERFDKHGKKIDEMIKLHLQSTNERLHKISKHVIKVTKSLEFTRSTQGEELAQSTQGEELGSVKNDIEKSVPDMKELENDLSDPNEVSEN